MVSRTVSPTGSYLVDVPSDAHEDVDGEVVSFWGPEGDVLLQLSSYRRDVGDQVSASQRLAARLGRNDLNGVAVESVAIPDCPDVAAAIGEDSEGTHWLYVYAVWEDLTVFATVSASSVVAIRSSWGMESLRSLSRKGKEMGSGPDF